MQTQEPAGDTAPAAEEAAQPTSAVTEAPGGAPLFTGPADILWGGFIGFVVVFVVVFSLLLRSRAGGRPQSARSRAQMKSPPKLTAEKPAKKTRGKDKEFFQPAGDGAEITFEDEAPRLRKEPVSNGAEAPAETIVEPEAEVIIERPAAARESSPPLAAPANEEETLRRASPFAGLFAKKRRDETNAPQKEPAVIDGGPAERHEKPGRFNPFSAERLAANPLANPFAQRAEEEEWVGAPTSPDPREERRRAFEEAERARAEAEEERRRIAAEAEEERRRIAAEKRAAAEREADFERRKQAVFERQQAFEERERALAARTASMESQAVEIRRDLAYELDERFQALSDRFESRLIQREADGPPPGSEDVTRALSTIGREIDDRFAALSDRLESRLASAVRSGAANDDRAEAGETISKRVAEHRDFVNQSLAAMASRIDDIAAAPVDVKALRTEIANLKRALSERASGPAAPVIQLSDIVRNALPPNAYEMRAMLPNNRKADCLIRLAHPPGPIAIDARFPVEAFHRLHAAEEGEERAENEFRRTALRHVVDIAERLIIPNETAESALMFVPSESMYAELHSRFPDVIQDSYRARVWIVSPTTLMATLHTVRAVLRDAQARESADLIQSEAQHVLAEVDALRRRVVTLEDNFNKVRHDVRDLISSTDQVYRRAETISNSRRSLTEGSLDRGSRRFPAIEEEPAEPVTDAEKPASEVKLAAAEEEPDLWEDNHSETDDRTPFPLR